MSGGPPPHGRVVGTFRVTEVTENTVTLVGEHGICKFIELEAEDVAYFPQDADFTIVATPAKKHDD